MTEPAAPPEGTPAAGPHHERRLLTLLATSRYSIGVAIVGTFVGATVLLAHGVLETVALVREAGAAWVEGPGHAISAAPLLAALAATDSFLIAVGLYVIAVGLYQLSFHPLRLPAWLVVHELDELEDKLARVVVVVLAVAFLGQAVTWDGQRDLLGFGAATALVIAALAFHLRRAPAPADEPLQAGARGGCERAGGDRPAGNVGWQAGAREIP